LDPATIKITEQQESQRKIKKRLGGGTRRERKAANAKRLAHEAEMRKQAARQASQKR